MMGRPVNPRDDAAADIHNGAVVLLTRLQQQCRQSE
jgi:hypothetical protein